MTGAPALIDVKQGGRPVAKSDVPLERTSRTQPFPVKPPPLARMTMTAQEIATVTPELEAACRKLADGLQMGGPYLPVSYDRLSVRFPGNQGGVNWGGTSFNPQLGYLFANTNDLGQIEGFRAKDPGTTGAGPSGGVGNRIDPAVNVNTGEFAWQVPLGVTDSLPPDKQNTDRPGNGGTIATAGGLVFVGATDDARFRAFDARTGKELWTFKLGGAAHATPSWPSESRIKN